ncbi:cupin domain-containing protein [Ornithinimicrobium sediminis]|uniref:cupin domain-containing protein n=1 Tax=Ornithinimicrobium sediminis TaxID=2904603 RepID=UPI001E58B968|nr:cupin domain-containing protein [Ornithinimicrobium sediminis]MCE0486938.1 cupin domain-containing protein [Ornithinimicrobium sediminis]
MSIRASQSEHASKCRNQPPVSSSDDDLSRFQHLPEGAGVHRAFLNHLATVKVEPGDSASGLGAVEFLAPRGFGPPLHVHREEDELFYVIDGSVRFQLDGKVVNGEAGAVLALPCRVAHTFQVESTTARFLTVVAGRRSAPSFIELVGHLGLEMAEARLPEPVEIHPGQVADACSRHGIDVLGPPPARQEPASR